MESCACITSLALTFKVVSCQFFVQYLGPPTGYQSLLSTITCFRYKECFCYRVFFYVIFLLYRRSQTTQIFSCKAFDYGCPHLFIFSCVFFVGSRLLVAEIHQRSHDNFKQTYQVKSISLKFLNFTGFLSGRPSMISYCGKEKEHFHI